MSLAAACGIAALRAAAVTGVGLAAARLLRGTLGRGRTRRPAWALLLFPLLTPALPVGYAYANFALSLVHHPELNQALYLAIVALRLAPAAVVILLLAPAPALSREAVRCQALLAGPRPTLADRAGLALTWARGPGRASIAAGSLLFLLAFQEFEIASLLGIDTWTVRVFDAQGKGLPLGETLRDALPALLLQAAALLPVLWLLADRSEPRPGERTAPRARPLQQAGAWLYLLLGAGVVTLVPASILLQSAWPGFQSIAENFAFAGELRASFLFAFAAGIGAMLLAGVVTRRRDATPAPSPPGGEGRGEGRAHECLKTSTDAHHPTSPADSTLIASPHGVRESHPSPQPSPLRGEGAGGKRSLEWPRVLLAALLVPGLMGPLVVALAVQALFQQHPLSRAYDTPLPLLTAMILLLLIPAALIALLFDTGRDAQATHAAAMLLHPADAGPRRKAQRLLWDLIVRPRLWVFFLLFNLAFFELTASSLLAPSDLRPASVMLYNLMHYGRNAVLSAMVCIAAALPVMLLTLLATGRWWGCWIIRPRA